MRKRIREGQETRRQQQLGMEALELPQIERPRGMSPDLEAPLQT